MADLSVRLSFALEIAREAGLLTLNYFQTDRYDVERKNDDSPVTRADREAEQFLRERIASKFPSDGVLGEEFGEDRGRSAYRWVLDPIDGTKSFISGVPLYSLLIGVQRDGHGVAGVIHIPALEETLHAAEGGGAWWRRGQGSAVRATVADRPLEQGIFVVSQVDSFAKRGAEQVYRELESRAYVTRSWGDGYGYLLVATGRADAMVDPVMNEWDAGPLAPILFEAGGEFRAWNGSHEFAGEGVGCSRRVLEEVLAVTRQAPRMPRP